MKKVIAIAMLLAIDGATALAQIPNPPLISSMETEKAYRGAIRFLIAQQVKEDRIPQQWKGEWPSYMENQAHIIALGPKGKRAYDSNCFTSALIYQELVDTFERDPVLTELPPTINLAAQNILTFKNEDAFNFWHRLPLPEKKRKKIRSKYKNLETFRPNQYELKNKFALVRANISNDADDTALAFLALERQKRLSERFPDLFLTPEWLPEDPTIQVNTFRDTQDRKQRYPTNVWYGNFKHTEAFLTWLTNKEGSFLLSPFRGWRYQLRIPEDVNNLDCVVNGNVLRMLAAHGKQNTPGFAQACAYIESAIDKGYTHKCGLFYPNPYHIHYSVAKAFSEGATCLAPSAKKLLRQIEEEQGADGSWKAGATRHPVQSTLYAGLSMMEFAREFDEIQRYRAQIDLAMRYLFNQRIEHEDGSISWPEGVLFSGGGFVRKSLFWKSEAYSTALALSAFSQYRRF